LIGNSFQTSGLWKHGPTYGLPSILEEWLVHILSPASSDRKRSHARRVFDMCTSPTAFLSLFIHDCVYIASEKLKSPIVDSVSSRVDLPSYFLFSSFSCAVCLAAWHTAAS
jgi:hypothetical protein